MLRLEHHEHGLHYKAAHYDEWQCKVCAEHCAGPRYRCIKSNAECADYNVCLGCACVGRTSKSDKQVAQQQEAETKSAGKLGHAISVLGAGSTSTLSLPLGPAAAAAPVTQRPPPLPPCSASCYLEQGRLLGMEHNILEEQWHTLMHMPITRETLFLRAVLCQGVTAKEDNAERKVWDRWRQRVGPAAQSPPVALASLGIPKSQLQQEQEHKRQQLSPPLPSPLVDAPRLSPPEPLTVGYTLETNEPFSGAQHLEPTLVPGTRIPIPVEYRAPAATARLDRLPLRVGVAAYTTTADPRRLVDSQANC